MLQTCSDVCSMGGYQGEDVCSFCTLLSNEIVTLYSLKSKLNVNLKLYSGGRNGINYGDEQRFII